MGFRKANSADRWLWRLIQVSRPSSVSGEKVADWICVCRGAVDSGHWRKCFFNESLKYFSLFRYLSLYFEPIKSSLAEACPGVEMGDVELRRTKVPRWGSVEQWRLQVTMKGCRQPALSST